MYAILSDIHGNMYAFQSVLEDMNGFDIEGVILLGDIIDYGMQSNEVVSFLQKDFGYRIICNIWGNHERAIVLGDFEKFSSSRGSECAKYTASILTKGAEDYLKGMNKDGIEEFELFGRHCLAVHGSLEDYFWKSISPDDIKGDYHDYDIVFSGHSHHPHIFYKFFDNVDSMRRNKHAALFINPGSVGQPRNHNPFAQYALLDENMNVWLRSVPYEVSKTMELFDGRVDFFYRDRLKYGV